MKIEDIYSEWEKDGSLDNMDLSNATANIPKLHNKYFKMYVTEGYLLKKMKAEYKMFCKLKSDYYNGNLDAAELKEYGWNPQPMKILRADIQTYVDSDIDVVKMSLKIGMQEAIVDYLESIIKQISNRNFMIKNIIDFEKFKTGA
jgi:hypothetical protein